MYDIRTNITACISLTEKQLCWLQPEVKDYRLCDAETRKGVEASSMKQTVKSAIKAQIDTNDEDDEPANVDRHHRKYIGWSDRCYALMRRQ